MRLNLLLKYRTYKISTTAAQGIKLDEREIQTHWNELSRSTEQMNKEKGKPNRWLYKRESRRGYLLNSNRRPLTTSIYISLYYEVIHGGYQYIKPGSTRTCKFDALSSVRKLWLNVFLQGFAFFFSFVFTGRSSLVFRSGLFSEIMSNDGCHELVRLRVLWQRLCLLCHSCGDILEERRWFESRRTLIRLLGFQIKVPPRPMAVSSSLSLCRKQEEWAEE